MDKKPETDKLIMQMLEEKSVLKQDVYDNTLRIFNLLKKKLKDIQEKYKPKLKQLDTRIGVEYIERSDFQAEFKIAGDEMIFIMHTNVFTFDREHSMWKTSYVNKNPSNSYCGMISIYNFLADSVKYSRMNDIGYLVGRIFINKDSHFFLEGKRQLGFLYNDFDHAILDEDQLGSIIESTILYCLDFDLYTPPYDQVKMASLEEIMSANMSTNVSTGKRLGFRFQADTDLIE
jgi:hypothetical protein